MDSFRSIKMWPLITEVSVTRCDIHFYFKLQCQDLPGESAVAPCPVKKSKFQEQQRKIDDLDAEEALDSRCLIALQ